MKHQKLVIPPLAALSLSIAVFFMFFEPGDESENLSFESRVFKQYSQNTENADVINLTGDVAAQDNGLIILNNTKVNGKVVEEDEGKISVTNSN